MSDDKNDPDFYELPDDGSIPKCLLAKNRPPRAAPLPPPEVVINMADRAEARSIAAEADRRWRNFVVPGAFEGKMYKVARPSHRQFVNQVRRERMPTEPTTPKKAATKKKAASNNGEKKDYIVPLKTADEARRAGTKAHKRFAAMRAMATKRGGKVLRSSALEEADYRPNDLLWDLKRKNVKVVTS